MTTSKLGSDSPKLNHWGPPSLAAGIPTSPPGETESLEADRRRVWRRYDRVIKTAKCMTRGDLEEAYAGILIEYMLVRDLRKLSQTRLQSLIDTASSKDEVVRLVMEERDALAAREAHTKLGLRKAQDARHAENRDYKREAIDFYVAKRTTLNKDQAAEQLAKQIPFAFRTIRGWLTNQ